MDWEVERQVSRVPSPGAAGGPGRETTRLAAGPGPGACPWGQAQRPQVPTPRAQGMCPSSQSACLPARPGLLPSPCGAHLSWCSHPLAGLPGVGEGGQVAGASSSAARGVFRSPYESCHLWAARALPFSRRWLVFCLPSLPCPRLRASPSRGWSGPSDVLKRVPRPAFWGPGDKASTALASNTHPAPWFASCPNWNTVDPEVRERLTQRHEDGEFW